MKKAVILSGGLGTRLKPFTNVIPKPLMPIGEKAILEIQIEKLSKFGFNDITLACNYKSEYIENFFGDGSRYDVDLHFSKEKEPLGTAGPLKLLEDKLTEPFIVMNGDIITLMDFDKLYNFSLEREALLTIVIKKIITPYSFGNIFFDGDIVTNLQEKPDIITYAMAGIYTVHPKILDLIPPDTYFGMDKLIKLMLEKNMQVYKYEIDDYWLDIGRTDDFEKAGREYTEIEKGQ
ncbi:MAG: NTP transferase domain-containing protein [Oscillospiraceae bacterium]|jgi:NDP-sugar pyrophosphorylase family protein|nr:NTP transferase domain-containing protein [Oscillospiraceae bacterium]